MNPALLETGWRFAGHQKSWLQVLARALLAQGADTRIFSPSDDPLEGEAPGPGRLSVRVVPELRDLLRPLRWIPSDTPRQIYAASRYLRVLRSDLRREPGAFSQVVFNYIDPVLVNWGGMGRRIMEGLPCEWSAFWIWSDPGNSLHTNRLNRRLAKPWINFTAGNLHRLFYLVEEDGDFLNSLTGGKAVWVPDFSAHDFADPASPGGRALDERAGGRPVVLLAGHLTARKGVVDFLRLAQGAEGAWEALFVLAGNLDRAYFSGAEWAFVAERLRARPPNLLVFPGRIAGEGEFNDLLRRASVLYAVYPRFRFSSNILAKAAVFEKPVLVAEGGCMARRVNEYELGLCCRHGHPAEALAACRHLAERGLSGPDGARRYLALHSRASFQKTVLAALHS